MGGVLISFFVIVVVGVAIVAFVWAQYSRSARESKNYERGLKMVPMLIHLPPSSDDIDGGNRDDRDITDEALSQAQVMYNIISSTATKGFKSKIHGQRHISFEVLASGGLVHYYVVAPVVLVDIIKQAVSAAYPAARLEEIEEHNIFSQHGKISGTIGGEFALKKEYVYPLATYQETKQDASRALLNALSVASKEDGAVIQMMLRPANDNWVKNSTDKVEKIREGKKSKGLGLPGGAFLGDLAEILWKPPESRGDKPDDRKPLTNLEQAEIEAIEGKTKYPGYETLIRVVVSSSTAARSQALLQNIISSFSLFDSPSYNGFKFEMARDIDKLTTDYVLRFFPQTSNNSILNSVELASIFHLPDQRSIPTSQIKRQMAKQVDGPTDVMDQGLLLGYNEFRGVKKPIRLSDTDRRRHTYIIGGTGMGKSVLLKNLAYQDMMDGRGFAFVDPHGDAVEDLLGMVPPERVDDIVYFNPSDIESPIGLNLFEFETQEQKDFLIQEAIAMLYKLYDPGHTGIIGPRYEHWFRNAALTIMSDPNGSTFIDVPQVFNDQGFTNEKLKHVKDQTVLDFWYKEMAQTSEANKSEVLGWFVSKFGAFLSNEMMRNILGQTKSGFNLRQIMDEGRILLVNLSKGTTGEINSQLLGMIFVMKFQAAAMGRANIPEEQRRDFCLYVDEFQNFATDSFESILSEARKYRLNLIVVNQFMTQLTDKIREAIIGNVGTMIAGRVGVTDAEVLQKKFMPTFDAEDLTKLPNFNAVASVMIHDVPSAPFSMHLIPQMGKTNEELRNSLKQYVAVKYGRPRAEVGEEIKKRLGAGDEARRKQQEEKLKSMQTPKTASRSLQVAADKADSTVTSGSTANFLDSWIEKKHQLQQQAANNPTEPIQPGTTIATASVASTPSAEVKTPDITPVTRQSTAQSNRTGKPAPNTDVAKSQSQEVAQANSQPDADAEFFFKIR